jgi:hypothetical protein
MSPSTRLLAASSEFAELWSEHEVAARRAASGWSMDLVRVIGAQIGSPRQAKLQPYRRTP